MKLILNSDPNIYDLNRMNYRDSWLGINGQSRFIIWKFPNRRGLSQLIIKTTGTISILKASPLELLPQRQNLRIVDPTFWGALVELSVSTTPNRAVMLCRPPSKGGKRDHPIAASSTLLFSQVHLWPITSPFPPFLSLFLSPHPLLLPSPHLLLYWDISI